MRQMQQVPIRTQPIPIETRELTAALGRRVILRNMSLRRNSIWPLM